MASNYSAHSFILGLLEKLGNRMTTQKQAAQALHNLHQKGNPLILYNVWDAGSAKAIEKTNAKAVATSSWAVAEANGYSDGENMPIKVPINAIRDISAAINKPLTVDLESGYGTTPIQVASTVQKAIHAGAVGFNLEDQVIGKGRMYSVEEQSQRIKACADVVKTLDIPAFINARTDEFLLAGSGGCTDAMLQSTFKRALAYYKVRANGYFVPGLTELNAIEELCDKCPIPVNVMVMSEAPNLAELKKAGVSRISFGPGPYLKFMAGFINGVNIAIS